MTEIPEESYPEIDKVCRICVREAKDPFPIFSNNEEELSIPMRLMMLSLDVKEKDGLPKQLCSECRYELEKFFVFRKRSQIADNKLRKHIRLLSLGKRSRVFLKSDDQDYDDDELEFEESIRFLKEQDALRNKSKEQWKEVCKYQLEKEFQKQLESLSETIKKECEDTMRAEVIDSVRRDLREEVCQEVRIALRPEIIVEVREELRSELTEQCRKEQLKELIGEIEVFLNSKKCGRESVASRESVIQQGTKQNAKPLEEPESQSLTCNRSHVIKSTESAAEDEENIDRYTLEVEENEDLKAETQSFNLDNRSFVVCHNLDIAKTEEVQDEQLADEIGHVLNTESKRITSYKIEENGDILFCRKKRKQSLDKPSSNYNDSSVMFLEIDDDMVQLVNMEENREYLTNKNEFDTVEIEDSVSENAIPFKQLNNCNTDDTKNTLQWLGSPQAKPIVQPRRTDTVKTIACELCPIFFSTQTSYKRHMRSHERVKERGIHYQCPVCKIYLSCSSALKRHILIHTGERPYACAECGKSFVQREILKRHMDTHTGVKNFECPHCQQRFAQKINLRTHINNTHLEERRIHTCHLCNKQFNHASGLSRHLTTHSGAIFQCNQCNREFSDRSSIKRHISRKHGVVEKHEDLIKAITAENTGKEDEEIA